MSYLFTSRFSYTDVLNWCALMGVIGLLAVGVDKGLAMIEFDRISERTLLLIAFAGGFWGIILGALIANHKISKPGFLGLAIFASILWIIFLLSYSLNIFVL